MMARSMHDRIKVSNSSSLPLLCSPQVCDKEWHHYVLNVEFPAVSLFVDGTTFEPFLVTEDYPMHSSKIETQLTIGACWQGKPMNYIFLHVHIAEGNHITTSKSL